VHLLNIDQLNELQVYEIYELADKLRSNQRSYQLAGKTFVLFFPESSHHFSGTKRLAKT
jgi:ornithine carbamoyltransferase